MAAINNDKLLIFESPAELEKVGERFQDVTLHRAYAQCVTAPVKGVCHATCYVLSVSSHQLNSKNNGPV